VNSGSGFTQQPQRAQGDNGTEGEGVEAAPPVAFKENSIKSAGLFRKRVQLQIAVVPGSGMVPPEFWC